MFEWVRCICNGFNAYYSMMAGKKNLNSSHFSLALYNAYSFQLQEGQLVVRHFQFLRWSPYRDVPDSKKAFLSLLAQVHNWQRECGEGRTIVHCL